MTHQTTKEEVADLLENFVGYINPEGKLDPWFSLSEINRQFAWDDVYEPVLVGWLEELVGAGKVEASEEEAEEGEGKVWRWLS